MHMCQWGQFFETRNLTFISCNPEPETLRKNTKYFSISNKISEIINTAGGLTWVNFNVLISAH